MTLLVGVVGISTWTAIASASRARRQVDGQFDTVIATIQQSKFPLTENVLLLLKGFSGADYVVSGAGRSLTTLGATERTALSAMLLDDSKPIHAETQRVASGNNGYLWRRVRLAQGPNAGVDLCILYPESLWRDALWEAVRPSMIFGGFGGAASIVLAWGVGQRMSNRILELDRRTRLIALGDFSPMELPRRNDELRDLGVSVNNMARQLAQFQSTMRKTEQFRLLGQVSGGLAHQIRNGVTGARLAIQLYARERPGNASNSEEALGVALRQLSLVEMHLQKILNLGREREVQFEPCDLSHVLHDVVALMVPQGRHMDVTLSLTGSTSISVLGDPGQLQQLFLNILTNALEAAGPGGIVEVRLGINDCRQAVAEIFDDGPGPAAAIAETVFEPFVTGKPEGVGLGLAVARRIATMHGGSIGWKRDRHRTCFHVEVPLRVQS
jgi:signal transduction histidine kinase